MSWIRNTGYREGGDVAAKKGARILWALDGRFLIVSGFSRQSERQITIYETRDLRQWEFSRMRHFFKSLCYRVADPHSFHPIPVPDPGL
jgi:hypothetical protein